MRSKEDESENANGFLLQQLSKKGYEARIVPIQRLAELGQEIQERLSKGQLDKEFYHQRLDFFDFSIPKSLPETKSIIVIAIPRPQAQVTFSTKDKKVQLILPPTYVAYQRTNDRVCEIVMNVLKEKNHRIASTHLPLKLLAVRSGLAEYGRNNITYVPGMGSFHQIVAAYTDLPCEEDTWRESRMMKRCQNCKACQKSCPTGAISADRFLLHAERCIVFHNEKKGDISFPSWMDPSWHNCLYGCLHCQRVCPEDRHLMTWIGEKEEFSQEETELILTGKTEHLPTATLQKLKNLDLADPESLSSLPRNLRVFF